MDDLIYTKLLKLQSVELTRKTPFCPEDQKIAEYFEGDLAGAEQIQLERHLTDCRYCLARVGLLERMENPGCDKRVPEAVLAEAKQIDHQSVPRRPWQAPAWAAAALVVITLFTVAGRQQEPAMKPGADLSAGPAGEESSRQLRNVNRAGARLDVLIPEPGADINTGSVIRWAEVPGILHHNIFILSRAGDVLWTERVEGNEWILPEALHFAAGGEYFFRVEARLADGRILSSKHLNFRISQQS